VQDEDDINLIATEIMTYLNQRPMASDSLEGIAQWWLVQQAIAKNVELVGQALELLVTEGKVLQRKNTSNRVTYSLNTEHQVAREQLE
jgi:hypothetical protein